MNIIASLFTSHSRLAGTMEHVMKNYNHSKKQDAQLLLGWPTQGAPTSLVNFYFRDLEMTPSRSSTVKFFADSERPTPTSQKCFISTTSLSRTIKKIYAIFVFVTLK